MSAFSRLQLAAALLEYDNDDENPNVPRRSAQESAIFAPMRRAQARPRPASRRATDYLSVALPSDTQGSANRKSFASHRKSQASIDALRNPFGADGLEEEESEEGADEEQDVEDMEVDLTSWGLDAFASKDKSDKRKSRPRAKSATLAGPGGPTRRDPDAAAQIANLRSRSMSVGNWDGFGLGGAFLEAESTSPAEGARPHSVATPLDLAGMAAPERPPHLRRHSDHILIDSLPSAPPLHTVPFPRSTTPGRDDEFGVLPRPASRSSRLELESEPHKRTHSNASMGSRNLLNRDEESSPFVLPPPSPDRASRFDPKARASRAMSTTSRDVLDENNPFALRPPSPSRTSRFDPKSSRARTHSMASLGSRMMPDGDGESMAASYRTRDRQYSKADLMRPKVLIMPSPLQNAVHSAPAPPPREGFELSTDGTPLPAGARAPRRNGVLSTIQAPDALAVPSAGAAFVPNPRTTLSLAQLTFRNQLLVGGQRDASYTDIDATTPRATVDGEQAEFPIYEPTPEPIQVIVDEPEEGLPAARRPAGKLYGRSLIDNLEARKAEIRGKTRTYLGGDRPSMMDRPVLQHATTLIDPSALQRPITQHQNSFDTTNSAPALGRRQSTLQPLLNFDGEKNPPPRLSAANPGMLRSRSVFGTDTLWEREMEKLKQMEEADRVAAEEQRKREEEEEAMGIQKKGKKSKKDKGKGKEQLSLQVHSTSPIVAETRSPEDHTPDEPSVLPEVQRVTVRRAPPPPGDNDSESESEESDAAGPAPRPSGEVEGWNSSDDEAGPRRTTGVGPRYPKAGSRPAATQPVGDDSSEEDVPLAATISRVLQRTTQLAPPVEDDSDEEKPLSTLLDKAKISVPTIDFDRPTASTSALKPLVDGDDDDDEQPLGLRASTLFPPIASARGPEEDDDVPLGLHPEQQRRSHYNLLAQQQQMQMQQQQQAMFQAQAMQSMFFSPPSVMGSGFFNPAMAPPPMAPPMMMAPPQLPSPPPLHDAAKLNRVDRWRREVSGGV